MPELLWRPPKQVELPSSRGVRFSRSPGMVMVELPTPKLNEGRSSSQSKTTPSCWLSYWADWTLA
jgi:hypothetical protein